MKTLLADLRARIADVDGLESIEEFGGNLFALMCDGRRCQVTVGDPDDPGVADRIIKNWQWRGTVDPLPQPAVPASAIEEGGD